MCNQKLAGNIMTTVLPETAPAKDKNNPKSASDQTIAKIKAYWANIIDKNGSHGNGRWSAFSLMSSSFGVNG